jgi:hypothetical protein
MRMATCHPDREHKGKGLCKQCYAAAWRATHRDKMRVYCAAYRNAHRDKVCFYRAAHKREARAYGVAYYAAHKEKCAARCHANLAAHKEEKRAKNLTRNYGITVREYETLLTAQGARCKICGIISNKRLQVDHAHATGRVRGLLCHKCNKGLGLFREDLTILASAALYLRGLV